MAQQDNDLKPGQQNSLNFDDLIPAASPAPPAASRATSYVSFQDLLPERPKPPGWAYTLQNSLAGFPDRMKRNIAGARSAFHTMSDLAGSLEWPDQSEPGQVMEMTEQLRKNDPDTRFMVETLGISPDALLSDDAQTAIGARFALSSKLRNTRLANDEYLKARRREIDTASARLGANQPDYGIGAEAAGKRFAEAVMTGSIDMIPAIVTSFATGSPATGAAIMGGQALGGAQAEGMEKGLAPDEATSRAMLFAAAEFIPEYVPMKILTQDGGGRLLRMLKAAGAEGIQESLTEVIQSGSDWASGVDEDMTWGEFVQNVLYSGAVGAGVGATLGAGLPGGGQPSLDQAPGIPPGDSTTNPPGGLPVATRPPATAARGPVVATDTGLDDALTAARNRPIEFGDLEEQGEPAAPPAGTGLQKLGGAAQAMSENLRARLWDEYEGRATAIDPRVREARKSNPNMTKDQLISWLESYDKIPTLTDRVEIPTLTDRVEIPTLTDRVESVTDADYPSLDEPPKTGELMREKPPAMQEAEELTPELVTDTDYGVQADEQVSDSDYRAGLDTPPLDLEATFDEAAAEVEAEQRGEIDFTDLEPRQGEFPEDVMPDPQAAIDTLSVDVSDLDHVVTSLEQGISPRTGKPFDSDGFRIEARNELEGLMGSVDSALEQAGATVDAETRAEIAALRARADKLAGRGADIDTQANEAATSPQNELPEPTQAQIEAGNYKKGHVQVHGLNISIENPKGSTRSGKDPNGKEWSRELKSHYGYIKRTVGNDGEQIDVFVGAAPESDKVFVVDQLKADGTFDEHKVMLGYKNRLTAHQGYKANYEKDWKVGPITEMTVPEFKAWLASEASAGPANPGFFEKKTEKTEKKTEKSAESPAATQGELPAILTESKLKYLKGMLKTAGIDSKSPGYATAKAKIEEQYEQDYDRALAGITYEQYKALNPDLSDSLSLQAYNQLRKQHDMPEHMPDETAPTPASSQSEQAESDTATVIHAFTLPNPKKGWKGGPIAEIEIGQDAQGFYESYSYMTPMQGSASPMSDNAATGKPYATAADALEYAKSRIRSGAKSRVNESNTDYSAADAKIAQKILDWLDTVTLPPTDLETVPEQELLDDEDDAERIRSRTAGETPQRRRLIAVREMIDHGVNEYHMIPSHIIVVGHEIDRALESGEDLSGLEARLPGILREWAKEDSEGFAKELYALADQYAEDIGLQIEMDDELGQLPALTESKLRDFGDTIAATIAADQRVQKAIASAEDQQDKDSAIYKALHFLAIDENTSEELGEYISSKLMDKEYIRNLATRTQTALQKLPNPKYSATVVQAGVHERATEHEAVIKAAKEGPAAHRAELGERLLQEINKGMKDSDPEAVAAYEQLLVDGELDPGVFGPAYFDAAYGDAVRQIERAEKEAERRARAARAQEMLESLVKDSDPASVEPFTIGWNHAMEGGTRSNLPTSRVAEGQFSDLEAGYARGLEAIEELGSARKRAKKMDRTGVLLRRLQDTKGWNREATGDDAIKEAQKAVRKLLESVSRSDAFEAALGDEATPGAKRAMESIRSEKKTPPEYLREVLGLWKPSGGGGRYSKRYTDADSVSSFVILGSKNDIADSFYYIKDGWQDRLSKVEDTLERYVQEMGEKAKAYDGATTVAGIAEIYSKQLEEEGEDADDNSDYLLRQFGGDNEGVEVKRPGPEKRLVRARFDRVRREGLKDHRGGRNITLKELKSTFGFADIHPGNYVTATQLQDHSNYSYDALMDFAEAIGWEPKDLGFGGRLHLAFGALGKGRHGAHYQDSQPVLDEEGKETFARAQVINLTNTKGDGALAHEYFHAIDFMNRRTFSLPGNSAQKTLMDMVVSLMRRRPDATGIQRQIESFYYGTYWTGDKRGSKTESAWRMVERMRMVIRNLLDLGYYVEHSAAYVSRQTSYNKNAVELGSDYWANREEMLARAGEAWVYDVLTAKGASDNYLVGNEVGDGVWSKEKGYKGTPYPKGDERQYINQLVEMTMKHLKVVDGLPTFTPDFLPEIQRVIIGPVSAEIDRVAATIPASDAELAMVKNQAKEAEERAKQAEVEAANLAFLQQIQQDNLQGTPEQLQGVTLNDLEETFEQAAAELEAEQQERTDADDRDGSTLLADAIVERGFEPKLEWRELFKMADAAYGGTQGEGKYTPKDAYDALEVALSRRLLASGVIGQIPHDKALDSLEALLDKLPTQTKRTEEQDEFQQFSTPPTIGYVMAYAANLSGSDILAEPSAGTGMLATMAALMQPGPQAMILNELSTRRADLLAGMPFGVQTKVHREDAAHLNDVLPKDERPTVVLMNPPFTADAGKNKGKRTNAVGMNHVEQALSRLEDGGRLVALVGQGMAHNLPQVAAFWKSIKSRYTVRANIGLSGESYRKFGTTFDNQLLVIDKTGPTKGAILTDEFKGKDALQNLKDALAKLTEVANARVHPGERYTDQHGSEATAGRGRFPGLPVSDSTGGEGAGPAGGAEAGSGVDAGKRKRNGRGGRDAAGGRPGTGPEPARGEGAATGANVPAGNAGPGLTDVLSKASAHGVTGASEALTGLYELFGGSSLKSFPGGMDEETYARAKPHFQKAWDEFKAAGRTIKDYFKFLIQNFGKAIKPYAIRFVGEMQKTGEGAALTTPAVEPEAYNQIEQVARPDAPRELTDSVFDTYHPQVTLPGSMQHPGTLVESAAMAAVMAPPTSYVPNLPRSAVQKGALSDAQIEQIIRAGDAHNQILPNSERKGYFIGDGTGLGKAREIVGIMLDNINNGRPKHVWISKDDTKLYTQALNDWKSVTGNDAKGLIHRMPDTSNEPIQQKDGILFLGYGKLRQAEKSQSDKKKVRSRLDQIVEWLGPDFDGVIAFDESHKMANAVMTKGKRGTVEVSATAQAGVELQKLMPNARVLYVSATGATEVRNFGYAARLGLWGERTPFADVHSFITRIASKGLAAMELVAQDMKALGVYLARSLSYQGIKYDTLRHDLTADQIEMYDTMAEAWTIILNNIDKALEATGATSNGKSKKGNNAKSAAKAAFWGAHQAFFNQILTAMQMPSLLADIEKQIANDHAVVLQMVNTNEAQTERAAAKAAADETPLEELDITPRQMLMQFLENSFPVNKYQTVTDEEGKEHSELVKDAAGNPVVSAEAKAIRDELLDRVSRIKIPLGALDQIIERFGSGAVAEITGRSRRLVDGKWQKRGTSAVAADIADFQGDKKKILAFSAAGGTGVDFHADLRVKNQRKRVHYLVQPGWRADEAVQGFGRTHRSNQKQPPEYVLVTTNIKGHLRFISSVARRLDQLGALTKGQRKSAQGMFSEEHNLETTYATEALKGLIMDAALQRKGVPEGFTLSILENEMGIDLRDKEGNVSATKIPAVTSFLNRVLALKFERQNFVFNAFFERMQDVIQYHKDQGDFDAGIETLRSVSTKKLVDQVVYTHSTGAKTRYVKLEIHQPVDVQTFADFMQQMANRKKLGELQFGMNKQSGRIYGFITGPDRTEKDGTVVAQLRRFGPTGNTTLPRADLVGKYDKMDQQQAMEAWNKEYADAPKTKAHDVHMIAGTILPIYDRIAPSDEGDFIRVVRAQTDEGERVIGLRLWDDSVADALKRLGAEQSFKETPEDLIRLVMKEDKRIIMANGWKMRRARVSGENRIEISLGRDSYSWSYKLEPHGLINERIDYVTRYFIPTGDSKTMAYILKQSPIADISANKEDGPAFSVVDTQTIRQPGSMRATDVRRAIADTIKPWENGPKVVVIRAQHELPKDAFYVAQLLGQVNGFYMRDQDTIWLVSDGIKSPEEAMKVLRHEAIGHFAFEREFQSDLTRIFRGVLALAKRDPEVNAIAAQVARDYADTPALVQASEIVARMAEQEIKTTILMRVRAALRALLRRVGLPVEFSKDELILMLRRAERSLRQGYRESVAQDRFEAAGKPRRRQKAVDPLPPVGSASVAETGVPRDFLGVGEETWRDSFARVAQDKFQRIFRIREEIKGQFGAGAVPESMDPVLAEELMNGKVEEDLSKLWKKHVEPLVAAMKGSRVTIDELGLYLMAKHAPDRNAHIQRVNPDFGEGGSGMTDAQAEAIIQKADEEGKLEELQELAKYVYAMNRERLKVIVQSGLETPETVQGWIEEFGDFYVPLKGGPNRSGFLRTGQGFDVRGKESLNAFGRRTLADNPVYYTIAQFEETLVRREKAEVGRRLMRLARKYPNPRFWEVRYVGNAPWRRRLNPNTLEVEWIPDIHQFNNKEQYFGVKADGRQYYIKINDPLALRALHNMGPDRLNIVTRTLGRFNRFLALVNTSLNPEFVISNFARDLETALYGIVAEQDLADGKISGHALVRKILKDVPGAMRGAYRGLRDKDPANQEWQKWFQEYKESGAKIGFFGLKGVEQIEGEIKSALQKAGPSNALHVLGNSLGAVRKAIDDVNGSVENAVRLSAYANARRAGLSKDMAASLAKNLTVNFNRKGELGVFMNSLYLFYNASTQGTAQFLRVMKSNKARALAGGIMAFGFLLAELNRIISGDDDDDVKYWDKIPDYEKERNLIIMKPGTDGEYWKFPLPYGYNLFFVAGTLTSSVMHGAQSVDEAALDLALTAAGSFNPIGMQDSEDPLKVTLKTVAPTVVQPFAQLAVNETFYGGPIYRENFPGGAQAPDSALGRESTNEVYKAIAEWLNTVSGGSAYRPGSMDIHPESIEHLTNFVTGSAGANVDRSFKLLNNVAQGQEVETRDIPFVRRLSGQAFDNEDASRFYDRHDQLLQFEAEYKGLVEGGQRREAAIFRRDHRQELAMVDKAKEVRQRLSDLYDRRRTLEARDGDVRLVNRQIERAVDNFNRDYNRSMDQ